MHSYTSEHAAPIIVFYNDLSTQMPTVINGQGDLRVMLQLNSNK